MAKPRYVMPERLPTDGVVRVGDDDGGRIFIEADGNRITMSPFNAWRIFGMLSLQLHLPLPKVLHKAIVLTTPGKTLPSGAQFEARIKL